MASMLETLAPGFLVAAPVLKDPNFDRTVVLMCIHNDDGAMGLVINRPSPFSIGDIMDQLGLDKRIEMPQLAMVGGPVALESGLMLYSMPREAAVRDDELVISQDLRLSPNRDLLQKIGRGEGPPQYRMFLGHAGWGPTQLEQEIAKGAWIPISLDLDLLFTIEPENVWEMALRTEGLNPAQISQARIKA